MSPSWQGSGFWIRHSQVRILPPQFFIYMRNLPSIKTLVIKIGSSIITEENSGINKSFVKSIAGKINELKKYIDNIALVSSGAIAAGSQMMGHKEKSGSIIDKQVCAAIGQTRLIKHYEGEFKKYNINVAQILITKDDLSNRRRYINARYCIRKLLELDIVPIINENDIVVVDELKYMETFGDNDNLASLIAGLIEADLLLILSDVNGLYDKNPLIYEDATILNDIKYIDKSLFNIAGKSLSGIGTGGMKTKLIAARNALQSACYVGIINGKDVENISAFLNGDVIGTFFSHVKEVKNRKKLWLGQATTPRGDIFVDDGAKEALLVNKKSLLPSGITSVKGKFGIGDVVRVISNTDNEIARGITRYSLDDIKKIAGRRSSEIFEVLGYKFSEEVIHRDDLVITEE